MLHSGLEHILHLHVSVDVVCDILINQSQLLRFAEVTLYLAVETVPHKFEHDIAVAVDAWTLSLAGKLFKHLLHIGHIVIAAETEVLGSPIVTTEERVDIFQSALACSGVTEMTHIEFARKRYLLKTRLVKDAIFLDYLIDLTIGSAKDLSNGIRTFRALTEHIFVSRLWVELDGSDTSAFLSTVVLFLHHQIELTQTVSPRTVFLLIVTKRFKKSHQSYSAILMNAVFHQQ